MLIITLSDGTTLDNIKLNGNNYISDTIITDDVFADNLGTVTIDDGETTQTYTDMVLIANRVYEGKSWFILSEKTEEQKKEEAMAKKMAALEAAVDGENLVTWEALQAAYTRGVESA